MTKNDFSELVHTLVKNNKEREDYFDSLPVDLACFFGDNVLINSVLMDNAFILRKYLGESLYEELAWFLYEWKEQDPEYHTITLSNGKEFIISNTQEFIEYIFQVYTF